MADLNIHIRISSKFFAGAVTLGLLGWAATELSSENITLSTYYPAPSGVYRTMITSETTLLASNGLTMTTPNTPFGVVIGGDQAAMLPGNGGMRLAVVSPATDAIGWGQDWVSNYLGNREGGNIELGGGNSTANPVSNGSPYIDFHFGNGVGQNYNTRIINNVSRGIAFAAATNNLQANGGEVLLSMAGATGVAATQNRIDLNKRAFFQDDAFFNGSAKFGNGAANGGCALTPYSFGGFTACGSGTYATYIPGVRVDTMLSATAAAGSTMGGQMFCCPN
jgi:hypothetical protein